VASSAGSERTTGIPVGTPPFLGIPREVRVDSEAVAAAGAGVPQQRAAADTAASGGASEAAVGSPDVGLPADGNAGTAGTAPDPTAGETPPARTATWPPVAAGAATTGTATTGSPFGGSVAGDASEPRVVSVADLGVKSTSAAFDPQAPQPLPERIRPLVGALLANAARVGLKLTLSCGRRVAVSCAGCGRLPASALAAAGAAWSVLDAGLPTPGVLSADDPVALALADVLLGGSGTVAKRAPERVEASVLRRHLGRALSPLAEPLQPYGVRGLDLSEPPPDTTPTELLGGAEMFAVRLTVELDSGPLDGALVVALPYRSLFGTAGTADVPRDEAANRALAAVPVDLTVRFPATTLPAYDIAGLEPGDVLRLEVAQPVVQGLVDGVQLLSGSLGRSGRRRAILVSSLESRLEGER
jgi:hypothetical protein